VLVALLASFMVGSVAGCGKKGDPQPPLRVIPAAAEDLSVRQQGTDLFLEMSYPNVALSGEALPGIDSVEVLEVRRPAPAEGFELEIQPREFAATAQPLLELRSNQLAAATVGGRLALRVGLGDLPEEGTDETAEARVFGARSTAGNGETSAISNLVAIVPRRAPEAPRGLGLVPGPEGVEVRWQRTEADEEGSGFHIYRRDARSRTYSAAPRFADAESEAFLDRSARFGQRYIYTVTRIAQREPLIESALGGEAEVFYQDRFPPASPSGLVALTEAERVRLRWDAGTDADIVGYNIYRKGLNDFVRLSRRPQAEREYVDERVRTGRTYIYRVTAVDGEGNESEASEEVTTTIR
jgi:predicted small lipoprotein YifL